MPASPSRKRRDGIVCRCLLVRQDEIVVAIRAGARTVAEVGEQCDAGTGCTGCHDAVASILEEEQARAERAAARDVAAGPQLGLFTDLPDREG